MIELDLVAIVGMLAYASLWGLSLGIGKRFNKALKSSIKFLEFYWVIWFLLLIILGIINRTVPNGFRNEYFKLWNEAAFYDYVMFGAYFFGMLVGILIINQLLTYLILILWESLKRLHQWINQL